MGSGDAQDEFGNFDQVTAWVDLVLCFVCILCAGLAAGLTIGLVSIDHKELKLLTINGTDEEKAQAAKILPLIKDHHWLLVTLFLFNATANEALPVFLSALVPEYLAIILSTFCVLIFGEIIPSSVFSGPNQLRIAANFSWVVKVLLAVFYVFARPIGLFLDWWLGRHDEEEAAPFNARDLYTLLSLSRETTRKTRPSTNTRSRAPSTDEPANSINRAPSILTNRSDEYSTQSGLLSTDAVMIAQGAIVSSKKTVQQVCQPTFFSCDAEEDINVAWMERMGQTGYSRILIEENNQKLHYFVVKELLGSIGYYLRTPLKVKDLPKHPILYFSASYRILDALNKFQSGLSRVGAVTQNGSNKSSVIGFFSMEDVVEEIIQEEIHDEKDSRHQSAVINALHHQSFSKPNSSPDFQMT